MEVDPNSGQPITKELVIAKKEEAKAAWAGTIDEILESEKTQGPYTWKVGGEKEMRGLLLKSPLPYTRDGVELDRWIFITPEDPKFMALGKTGSIALRDIFELPVERGGREDKSPPMWGEIQRLGRLETLTDITLLFTAIEASVQKTEPPLRIPLEAALKSAADAKDTASFVGQLPPRL